MTLERFALLWGSLFGLVAGGIYLMAWQKPSRNRATRFITRLLAQAPKSPWRLNSRLQMFIIGSICVALAIFGLEVFFLD